MTTSLRKCVSLALMVASLALGAASSAVWDSDGRREPTTTGERP